MRVFTFVVLAVAALTFAGCTTMFNNTVDSLECAVRPQTCVK